MSYTILPQVITRDLYPNLFLVDVPGHVTESVIDPSLDTYPYPYQYNDMPVLQYGIDPKYVTAPQKHEYRYVNNNGVDVVIRGTYGDVMSAVDVLRAYPPKKRDCAYKSQRFDLRGNISTQASTVPDVGVQTKGEQLWVKINDKVYSGSGSLIMVVQSGRPLNEAKFLLFRDSKNSLYQDLGGRIDMPNNSIDKTILFKNAAKESEEESMLLIKLITESPFYVDIESQESNTYYRVYLYMFETNNVSQLPNLFEQNKLEILGDYAKSFNESYREMNKLDLFDYQTFINRLSKYNVSIANVSSGVFQTIDGTNVNVRGRAMRVIAKMVDEHIFNKIMINRPNPISINMKDTNNLFNSIQF